MSIDLGSERWMRLKHRSKIKKPPNISIDNTQIRTIGSERTFLRPQLSDNDDIYTIFQQRRAFGGGKLVRRKPVNTIGNSAVANFPRTKHLHFSKLYENNTKFLDILPIN